MKSPLEQDHYEVLEIGRAASLEEIERAYRVVRETYDGDNLALYSMFADRDAAQIRERIDEAYQVLLDPEKRQRYDRFGRAGVGTAEWPTDRGFEGTGFPGGFGDIFDAFFGGFGADKETGSRRGADLHFTLNIPSMRPFLERRRR